MTHEVLFLNSRRSYVLVNSVWYDTNKDLNPVVGQQFLLGKIEKVLSYEDYTKQFPESKTEIYPLVTEKTISGGFIRKIFHDGSQNLVKYGINPVVSSNTQSDLN